MDEIEPWTLYAEIPATDEEVITNAGFNAAGQFKFHINGVASVIYIVQRSADFQTWTDQPPLVGESDYVETVGGVEAQFYRVKIVQPPARVL